MGSTGKRKYTTETIIEEFRKYWGDRFDYSLTEYTLSDSKLKIICPEHGIFELRAWQHKKGVGCYQCGRISSGKISQVKLRKTTDDFITKAKKVFGELYDYSKVNYTHSHEPVTLICQLHGEFNIQASRHLEGQGCSLCGIQASVMESNWLNEIGLPNTREYRGVQIDLIDGTTLVDGYDPDTNTVYEFHGDFWHGNPEQYNQNDLHPMKNCTYGELYEKTVLKDNKIRESGYNLVTIWESNYRRSKGLKINYGTYK